MLWPLYGDQISGDVLMLTYEVDHCKEGERHITGSAWKYR